MTSSVLRAFAAFGLALVAFGIAAPAAHADGASILGGGSGFAALEIDQWRADTARSPFNLTVNYVAQGSTFGRQQFAGGSFDYGASDIQYQQLELNDLQSKRCKGRQLAQCFVYVPVSVGGLAFMYNLQDNSGNRVTNLKLTRPAACKIFTGAITKWNDPEIVATNPQFASFNRVIKPVVRTDGAGESYVFSEFCIAVAPGVWQAFVAQQKGLGTRDLTPEFLGGQPTSVWPQEGWGANPLTVASADGTAGYVADPTGGPNAITYVAAGYAKVRSFPTASVQNAAGAFTQPDEDNVTRALGYAQKRGNGTFQLAFNGPDPIAYFPSTYSYVLAQTAGFDPGKGATLARFLCYAVSQGQVIAPQLRYARLSSVLVSIAIDAIVRIPGAPAAAQCPVAGAPPPPPPPPRVVVGGIPTTTTIGNTSPNSPSGGTQGSNGVPGKSQGPGTQSSVGSKAGLTGSGGTAVTGQGGNKVATREEVIATADAELARAGAVAELAAFVAEYRDLDSARGCGDRVRSDDGVESHEAGDSVNARLRALRTLSAAVIAGAITMAVAAPSSGATPAKPQQFVSLQGEGSWSVTSVLVPWQNDLASANSFVNLNYVKHGSFLGRQDLIAKNVDFAISGVPLTADELAPVDGGASAFIAAPIQVATLATFVEPPQGGFQSVVTRCDPDDESTWPPDVTDGSSQCIVKAAYTGAIRIPNRNLGAMFLHYLRDAFPPLVSWNNADVLAAFGVDAIATGGVSAAPQYAGRSDPDEITYYLQQFVKTAAPDVWQGNVQANPTVPWEPITERLGQASGITRDGAEQQLAQLVQGGCGTIGLCANDVAGGIAPAPPSMVKQFRQAFPKQPVELAQMQNANGDWVAPTADAINKAVDTGGDSPLYALTNKVPGAYPLVWVDHLYAPAHGLSIEKTEGLAMTIRYLATTGQEKENATGEGRLPPALVAKALAAADKLVSSNCTGSGRHIVTSSDPGPLAPPSATAMRSIGPMLHCEAVAGSTTSTSTAPTTTTTLSGASVTTFPTTPTTFGSSYTPVPLGTGGTNSSSGNPPATVPAGTSNDTPTTTATRTASRSVLLTASKLPLGQPAGASGTDRLATFLLGAVLYLLLRKPVGRLARRIAA